LWQREPVSMTAPPGRTTVRPSAQSRVEPYLTARMPPAFWARLPPMLENLALAGSGA